MSVTFIKCDDSNCVCRIPTRNFFVELILMPLSIVIYIRNADFVSYLKKITRNTFVNKNLRKNIFHKNSQFYLNSELSYRYQLDVFVNESCPDKILVTKIWVSDLSGEHETESILSLTCFPLLNFIRIRLRILAMVEWIAQGESKTTISDMGMLKEVNRKRIFDYNIYKIVGKVFCKFSDRYLRKRYWNIRIASKSEDAELQVFRSKCFGSADPFLLDYKGKTFLFFEVLEKRKDPGKIAVSGWETSETVSNLANLDFKIIIDTGYHLSFPFVFLDNGKLLMTPESTAQGSNYFYESIEPFGPWVRIGPIKIDYPIYDPIIINKYNKYILIGSRKLTEDCSGGSLLEAFESDSLEGEWTKILSFSLWDDRTSRNAGYQIENDRVKRFSQSFCGDIYGHHVSSHIIRLELVGDSLKLSFHESTAVNAEYRSHHLSFSENWVAYDVFD
jgi:hypothetical protein